MVKDDQIPEALNLVKALDPKFFKQCELEILKKHNIVDPNCKSIVRGFKSPLCMSSENYFIVNHVILMIRANLPSLIGVCIYMDGWSRCKHCNTSFVDYANGHMCAYYEGKAYRCAKCHLKMVVKFNDCEASGIFDLCEHKKADLDDDFTICVFCGLQLRYS